MRKFSIIALLNITAFALLFGLFSCDRLPVNPDQQGTTGDEDIAALQVETPDLSEPEILLDPKAADVQLLHRGDHNPYFRIGCILKQLNLTESQQQQVRTFLQEYHDCIHNVKDSLRSAIQPILENYRMQFREILAAYRNGEIDRDSLRTLLTQLRQNIREDLLPLYQWAQEAINGCKDQLIANIEDILTEEQLELWRELLATGGDCHGRRFRDHDHGRDRDHGRDHGRFGRDG